MTNGAKVVTIAVVLAALAGLAILSGNVQQPVSTPVASSLSAPAGYVTDTTGTLTVDESAALEAKLSDFEKSSTVEVAVVVVPSLGGKPIEQYAIELADAWKVGKADTDNGVIFLVAIQDRKMRIEVGHGLEGDLTDSQAGNIIRDVVAPYFRAGRYSEGINAGVDAIINQVAVSR